MKVLLAISLLLMSLQISSQKKSELIDLPDSIFKKQVEISGIIGDSNSLYLVSEGCKEIYELDNKNYEVIKTIELHRFKGMPRNVDIEAITLWDDDFLLTDEEIGNIQIYQINRKTNSLFIVKPKGIDISDFNSDFGIEGIATNKNICYVLRERNKTNKESEIYSFKMSKDKNGKLGLEFLDKLVIKHCCENERYTDIYYNKGNSKLYCLGAFYNKECKKNARYWIDTIDIEEGKWLKETIKSGGDIKFTDISEDVKSKQSEYSTNLEGIYVEGNTLYIVSDNHWGKSYCSENADKNTMLLKIEL